jgi:hypothetical protein
LRSGKLKPVLGPKFWDEAIGKVIKDIKYGEGITWDHLISK